MVDWRLLLFVVFGIFHPIISDQNLIDGKETCCIQFPTSIPSEPKFSTDGLDRFIKTPDERRLNTRNKIRDIDSDTSNRRLTRQTLERVTQNRDIRLQYRERDYDINNERRVARDITKDRVLNSKYTTRSDIPKSSGRERVLERNSRSYREESRRSVDREIYGTRNIFVQRLKNNRERRVINVRDRRDRFGHDFAQRLNGDHERRLTTGRNNRDVIDEHNEHHVRQLLRNTRSLARSREYLDAPHIEQARSRSEEYRRDVRATSRNERQERVLIHINEKNDDLKSLLRERFNDNHRDRVRDNILSRNTEINFASRENRESNKNNEKDARLIRRVVSENNNELNRRSRSRSSRNINGEMTQNRDQSMRVQYNVARLTNKPLERTIRYGDRSNEINRSFFVENVRNRDERRINSRLSLRDNVRVRDTQVRVQEMNRNLRNRENIRINNRKNERTFQREQDVRENVQRETRLSDLDYRRYTDASNNRARSVLRENNIGKRELRSSRASILDHTRETRNDIRNNEFQSTRRIQERTEAIQMNRQPSAFERMYSTAPTDYRNAERQQNIERQERQNFGFTRNTNAVKILESDSGFEMKLHHVLYIIQGLYLISILINMSVKDKEMSKKNRLSSWLTTRIALKID